MDLDFKHGVRMGMDRRIPDLPGFRRTITIPYSFLACVCATLLVYVCVDRGWVNPGHVPVLFTVVAISVVKIFHLLLVTIPEHAFPFVHGLLRALDMLRQIMSKQAAAKLLKRAADLVAREVNGLLQEVDVLQPHVVGRCPLQSPPIPYAAGMASYETKVLDFVEREASSSLLGISGMRGVGKTTLLRFVRDSYAHGFSCFSHVFFVGAGTGGCTLRSLQHVLAINMGLHPPTPQMSDAVPPTPNEKTSGLRTFLRRKKIHIHGLDQSQLKAYTQVKLGFDMATSISSSLKGRPFLLLLDDVRERLDLSALGLPTPLGHRQKVIFTTRKQAICGEMGCTSNTTIQMECLGEDDAWSLFKDKVGDDITNAHPHINLLAKKMAAECRGLPSALCALGRAMSTKTDVKQWRYAYSVLIKRMRPAANEIQETDDQGYSDLHRLEDELQDIFF